MVREELNEGGGCKEQGCGGEREAERKTKKLTGDVGREEREF